MDLYIKALISLSKYTIRNHPISTLNLQPKYNRTVLILLKLAFLKV